MFRGKGMKGSSFYLIAIGVIALIYWYNAQKVQTLT